MHFATPCDNTVTSDSAPAHGVSCMQGVWEKDEVRKDDSFNTFEVPFNEDAQ